MPEKMIYRYSYPQVKLWKGVIIEKLQPRMSLENQSQEVQWKWRKMPWKSPIFLSGNKFFNLACILLCSAWDHSLILRYHEKIDFTDFFSVNSTYNGTSCYLNLKIPINRYFHDLIPKIGNSFSTKFVDSELNGGD